MIQAAAWKMACRKAGKRAFVATPGRDDGGADEGGSKSHGEKRQDHIPDVI